MRYSRGYNAVYSPWRGFPFPNNLSPSAGAPELSWEAFCAGLYAADVDRLRVKLVGWNRPIGTQALSYEPTLGQFNDWNGRLQEAVIAANNHGIGFQVIPFDRQEFMSGWANHAWNSRNGGWLSDPRACFTDPRAIDAAKARISSIAADLEAPDGTTTILCWELVAEMPFMITPAFWGVANWGEMGPVVHGILVPWVEDMAQYIQGVSSAPIGNGNVFAPQGFNEIAVLRNEVFRTPSLDYALVNWYGDEGDGTVKDKVAFLRACQNYTGLPIYVEQYAPWIPKPDAPYTREPDDFSWSKEHEWAAACGESGVVGPQRWPEIKPRGATAQWWGVASPEMATIAGVTAEYARTVQSDGTWAGPGHHWDDRILGTDIDYVSSWGDGRHVTAFVAWRATGAHDLAVQGLAADGTYTARWYDWLVGDLVVQRTEVSAGGTMFLSDVPHRDGHAVLYLSPTEAPSPPTTITLRVTAPDGAVQSLGLEPGQSYTLDVVEGTP